MAKEKIICAGMALFLTAAFISCGGRGRQKGEAVSDPEKTNADHVIMTLQTLDSSRTEDLDEVMEAINAITIPEINVEVEARLIDSVEAFTQYSLWISNEETVDLMMLNYQDITSYISKGMLLPLEQLLEGYGPDISRIMEEEGYALTEGSIVQGKAYGVATVQEVVGSGGGIWFPESCLKEAGIDYDLRHVYTLDELSEIFRRLKEVYPDKYPLGQITSGNTYSTFAYYGRYGDSLGGDLHTGMIEEGGARVVNFYASDQYYDFLAHMREWYLSGYIYPDAAFTDADIRELISSGILLSFPRSSSPGMGMEEAFGGKTVCLRTAEVTSGAQYSKAGFWTIPVTSRSPEAAMRFLNMMFGDGRISKLITHGIEGKHYVVTDRENRLIRLPDGMDTGSVGYYNPLGLYGDMRKNYSQGTIEYRKAQQEYSEEGKSHSSGIRGIVYSTANVDKEIGAVVKVVEKYAPILESGSVDLEVYYPEFLQELEQAGIDRIIEDKQAQYDEWLAAQDAEG